MIPPLPIRPPGDRLRRARIACVLVPVALAGAVLAVLAHVFLTGDAGGTTIINDPALARKLFPHLAGITAATIAVIRPDDRFVPAPDGPRIIGRIRLDPAARIALVARSAWTPAPAPPAVNLPAGVLPDAATPTFQDSPTLAADLLAHGYSGDVLLITGGADTLFFAIGHR